MKKISALFIGLLLSTLAFAGVVPDYMNYQGVLRKGDGTALDPGLHTIEFRIYNAANAGDLLWGRVQQVALDAEGHFNTLLMSGGSAIDAVHTHLHDVFNEGGDRFLELTVEGSTPIKPRQQLVSAPFAFLAGNVEKAQGNFTVQGLLTAAHGAHVDGNLTVGDDLQKGSIVVESKDGEINIGPTGWRKHERAAILVRSKGDHPAEIDLRNTAGENQYGWQISSREGAKPDLRFHAYTGAPESWDNRLTLSHEGKLFVSEAEVEEKLTVHGNLTVGDDSQKRSIVVESKDGEINIGPTGWRKHERAAILVRSKGDHPAEIDLRNTAGENQYGWQISSREGTKPDLQFHAYTGEPESWDSRLALSHEGKLSVKELEVKGKLSVKELEVTGPVKAFRPIQKYKDYKNGNVHTAPSDGYLIYYTGKVSASGHYLNLYIDGDTQSPYHLCRSDTQGITGTFPIAKGETWRLTFPDDHYVNLKVYWRGIGVGK